MRHIGRRSMKTKARTRPKKTGCDRRRRVRNQKKRLAALGVPEESIRKLHDGAVRAKLRELAKAGARAKKRG